MKNSFTKRNGLLLLLLTLVLAVNTSAQFAGGAGTSGDPYQVATSEQLYNVRSYLSSYFIQTADIDLSSYQSGYGWTPIGIGPSTPSWLIFTGSYDGNGFSITGMIIDRASDASSGTRLGLFGYIQNATLTRIKIVNATVSGGDNGAQAGILAGYAQNATISYCNTSGSISAKTSCGGLIGSGQGSITSCYSTATVSKNSYGTQNFGGLVGDYGGTITNCYSLGNVSGENNVGGFVGYIYSGGNISNCYSKGSVSGNSSVGGFCGYNTHADFMFGAGGVISICFWDTQTSGTANGIGGGTLTGATGKTTTEMKTASTFTNAGWDFTTVWQINGSNYPDLINNQNSALPVELTSFTATSNDGKVLLNWQTATEVNNYGFEIERALVIPSGDEGWEKIAFVQGHGNSNSSKNYSFEDASPNFGLIQYRLKQIDFDGKYEYSSVIEVNVDEPVSFTLNQNYPNPFNPETTISYNLPVSGLVTLKVYDLLGSEITTLVNDIRPAGIHQVKFIGKDFSSGIYFYKIQCGSFTQTKKLMLLK